jgi:hypothetical protein
VLSDNTTGGAVKLIVRLIVRVETATSHLHLSTITKRMLWCNDHNIAVVALAYPRLSAVFGQIRSETRTGEPARVSAAAPLQGRVSQIIEKVVKEKLTGTGMCSHHRACASCDACDTLLDVPKSFQALNMTKRPHAASCWKTYVTTEATELQRCNVQYCKNRRPDHAAGRTCA